MVSSQIRQEARNNLTGKWGKAALLMLIYSLIVFGFSIVIELFSMIPIFGLFVSLGSVAINIPIAYGILVTFIKLKRNEEVSYTEFLESAFSNFKKVWGVVFQVLLKLLPAIALLIVAIILFAVSSVYSYSTGNAFIAFLGIVLYIGAFIYLIPKSLLYTLVNYILYDNPDLSYKEIVEKSENLMRGNRWRWFWLYFTFIGWGFLNIFTFGIGTLWLTPYIFISQVIFYEDLAGKLGKEEAITEEKIKAAIPVIEPEIIPEPVPEPVAEELEEAAEVESEEDKEEIDNEDADAEENKEE